MVQLPVHQYLSNMAVMCVGHVFTILAAIIASVSSVRFRSSIRYSTRYTYRYYSYDNYYYYSGYSYSYDGSSTDFGATTGVIIGVIFGIFALTLVIALTVYFCCGRRNAAPTTVSTISQPGIGVSYTSNQSAAFQVPSQYNGVTTTNLAAPPPSYGDATKENGTDEGGHKPSANGNPDPDPSTATSAQ